MSKEENKKSYPLNLWNLIKYIFSLLITIYASVHHSEIRYLLCGLIEISLIFCITDLIYKKNKIAAYFLDSILSFLYNFQIGILIFGSSFLSRIMLSNLSSIEDLIGRAFVYITAAVIVILISFLKFKENTYKTKIDKIIIITFIFIQTLMFSFIGIEYSPLFSYISLIKEEVTYQKTLKSIKDNNIEKNEFYKDVVEDVLKANHGFEGKPNVILIFTEGLSQNIVLDDRNIMPNVREYEQKSINFTGYYNHTYATYRGIIGQLYSGYQNENLDENHLISLQSILKDNGYYTSYINTEPNNKEFTNYVNSFNFDEVVSNDVTSGSAKTLSDKEAYEKILSQGNLLNEKNKPFFLCIYTFGTHVSLDSTDEKFGDGSNNVLNRFYDVDFQFGKFIKEFEKSKMYDNTILVFTTDHCAYRDKDYISTFGKVHERTYTMLDDMPLFIYHKNIEPKNIEVDGRNSLCLAPTILDYLDISAPNYFFGSSLFSGEEDKSEFEYAYQSEINYCTTKDKILMTDNSKFDENMKNKIQDYFSVSSK